MFKPLKSIEVCHLNGSSDSLTVSADATGITVYIYNPGNEDRPSKSAHINFTFEEALSVLSWLDSLRLPILEAMGYDPEVMHEKIGLDNAE